MLEDINGKEFILCAAIHYDDGEMPKVSGIESGVVICGRRHSDCFELLSSFFGEEAFKYVVSDGQGFMTSHNRYVSRKEAFQIAKANNQIQFGLEATDNGEDSILISENLY